MSADRDEWDGGSLRTSGYDTEEDSMPEFEVPEGEEMEDAQDVAAEELEGAEDEHSVLIAPPSVTEATVELPERSTKPPELPEEPVAAPSSGEFKDMVDENQAKQPPSAQDLDWKALESKFAADMYNKRVEEHDIQEQFDALMKFYQIWSDSGVAKEEERARKRLKTRIRYVQHAEMRLQQKKDHHEKVMGAFHQAMSFLKDAS